MKQLTCEMCGGTSLIKQDGVFVCQNCGMKYSVDDAKKLMIEGPVDVTGSTVKIDNKAKLNNLYSAARSSKDMGAYAQAANYYREILTLDSMSAEAKFNSVFCDAMGVKVYQIPATTEKMKNAFLHAFSTVNALYVVGKITNDDIDTVFESVGQGLIVYGESVYSTCQKIIEDNFPNVQPGEYMDMIIKLNDGLLYPAAVMIAQFYEERPSIKQNGYKIAGPVLKTLVSIFERYSSNMEKLFRGRLHFKSAALEALGPCIKEIRKREPSYILPAYFQSNYTSAASSSTSTSSGGCYVATAVYGSYDCPEVWTLRRYRDYCLAETWYGKAFIKTYYAISPCLVKWFGNRNWFKKTWRIYLDKTVRRLQSDGYEATPYKDKIW